MRPIRVLAADDSAVMRGVYRRLFRPGGEASLAGVRGVELCGIVEDGVACLDAVCALRPDVVVLDVEMPRMHGLEVLKRLRREQPGLPVILCSSSTESGAQITFEALALGAADYVTKPGADSGGPRAMEILGEHLLGKVAALGHKRIQGAGAGAAHWVSVLQQQCAGEPVERVARRVDVVVIGVSTGGPSALEQVLPRLPADFPAPVLIAQHMPKVFTAALAERLNRGCALHVREAYDGARIRPGEVWLAPGDAHMEIHDEGCVPGGAGRTVRLWRDHERNFCTPSADVLFRSAARTCGGATLAVVMTGMGADGLAGARSVHQAGGTVIAQDEATSAVWGMPGRVFEAGIVRRLLPVQQIAEELMQRVAFPAMRQDLAVAAKRPVGWAEGQDTAAGRIYGVQ
ncbi:MAG: chemotaxis response regulator protein-glutamate methylesterase [Acidobacteriota bacterium]|nr:chemotaxis response regulator protein-glutamate methylesterase [Acidobacteriota bacterium]